MKNKINVFCLAVVCTVMSCAPGKKAEEPKTVAPPATLTAVMVNNDCLDRKMELWFSKFDQFQDEGYAMEEANQKAIAAVAKELGECDQQNERMATDAAPSDE